MADMKFTTLIICAFTIGFTSCNSTRDSAPAVDDEDRSETAPTRPSADEESRDKAKEQNVGKEDDAKPAEPSTHESSAENEKAKGDKAGENHSSTDSRPGIELSIKSSGDKPKHLLRYDPRKGTSALYSGEIRQLTEAPHPVGAFEVIYRFKLRQTIGETEAIETSNLDQILEKQVSGTDSTQKVESGAKEKKAFSIRYDLEDIKIEFPKRLEIETGILEQTLSRIHFAVMLTPRGLMTPLEYSHTENIRQSYLEDLSKSLPRLHPVYPLEPVGPGAAWEQTNVFTMQQDGGLAKSLLKTTMSNRYKVVSVSHGKFGPAMELKVNTKIDTKGTSSNMDVVGEGGGEGKTVVLLRNGLVYSYRNLVKVVTKVKDQRASNTTAVNLQLIALDHQRSRTP